MTKGIFLCAFGDPCYGRAAFNLALSIKHYDPQLQICLLRDQSAFSKGNFDMSVFDIQIPLTETNLSNPARIKTSVYEHLPFDYNLYLDVDALALQSLEPLLERLIKEDEPYRVYVYETYDETSPEDMPMMYWAKRSVIWNHYNLTDHKLPATQSSIQFIKKCDESKKIFEQVNKNLDNPIPLDDLDNQWGGSQPDELYLNVALAQLGINPHIGNETIFFANKYDKRSLTQLQNDHYILSIYGGKEFTRPTYKDWYDRLMHTICYAKGMNHVFKIHYVLQNKHADKKTVLKTTKKIINKKSVLIPKPESKQISLAITHFERYDMVIDSFKEVINDSRISEIVISDDFSQDGSYEKLKETFKDNTKVKIYQHEHNLGMSLNKMHSINFCSNDWVILFDSDNKINTGYIDKLFNIGDWNEKIIYCPDQALPQFNYKAFSGIAINQQSIKQYLNKPMFDCLLNTCNYFVNRNEYLKVYVHDAEIKESDTIHFNHLWLKEGNRFYVVPGMNYQHRVHNGSGFLKNADYNLSKAEETKQLIAAL